jgi:S1-C subfamily serine protease
VNGMNDLQRLIVAEQIGATVTFTVARGERLLELSVVPSELAA